MQDREWGVSGGHGEAITQRELRWAVFPVGSRALLPLLKTRPTQKRGRLAHFPQGPSQVARVRHNTPPHLVWGCVGVTPKSSVLRKAHETRRRTLSLWGDRKFQIEASPPSSVCSGRHTRQDAGRCRLGATGSSRSRQARHPQLGAPEGTRDKTQDVVALGRLEVPGRGKPAVLSCAEHPPALSQEATMPQRAGKVSGS